VQRFRWIPPSTFMMGSPEGEAGRLDDEGPQHQVTLSQGYWLGETPVTQAFWKAVLDDNPSRFVSDDRPVEQVSWDDCQRFVDKLNRMLPGLWARLPTEAEWEYACRAGFETATWLGDLEILGQSNAPLLDRIAWYSGNCGVGFELDNGYDMSSWSGKQYKFDKGGTRPVKLKEPNPLGLYDLLGNVYEWCSDWYGPYSKESVTNPSGPEAGSSRVFRGGSWLGYARCVRAAYRLWFRPACRDDDLGLRLARGQGPEPGAEPQAGERSRRQGGGAGRDPAYEISGLERDQQAQDGGTERTGARRAASRGKRKR
jgi:formylglycine-generating enzyme required for sulfatase activity